MPRARLAELVADELTWRDRRLGELIFGPPRKRSDVDILVEREILDDGLAGLLRFVMHAHQDHGVECVDGRHP